MRTHEHDVSPCQPNSVAGGVRCTLAEAAALPGAIVGRPFGAIMMECVNGPRTPAANRSCRAARVLP
jgi:hypothetical protein